MIKILFICHGNICRSPMAEFVMKDLVQKAGLADRFKIASACGLDPDKAYVLGLLHDVGRRYGKRHLGHVSDGYSYMMSLGYDEVARICLSHSFNDQSLDDYVGNWDTSPEETALIERTLSAMVYDEYDRLIQLCDSLAGAEGVLDIEERMQRFSFLEIAMQQNDLAFEVRDYLRTHPNAAVVNLGCGLDSTGRSCDNGRCRSCGYLRLCRPCLQAERTPQDGKGRLYDHKERVCQCADHQ